MSACSRPYFEVRHVRVFSHTFVCMHSFQGYACSKPVSML